MDFLMEPQVLTYLATILLKLGGHRDYHHLARGQPERPDMS